MIGSNIIRWLLGSVLALAATGSNLAPATAQSCAPQSAYQQQAVWSVPGSVPLVIHIMERPLRPCVVRSQWTPEKVALVFGPSTEDRRGVNSIWGPTGITFSVRKVEIHEYSPPAGMLDAVPDAPTGSREFEDGFKDLVSKFHRVGSVNVYLWDFIPGFAIGFGRSPITGNGKATAWLESACLDPSLVSPDRCGRKAAHELGHALGLYHVGVGCAGAQPAERCERLTAPCPESQDSERLMRKEDATDRDSDSKSRKLCTLEVTEAKLMAKHQLR